MREADYPARLTQAEEQALIAELVACRADGDRARYLELRSRLALSSLRLVRDIARKFRTRALELEDILQEGYRGLLSAVDRFDPARAGRFVTFAFRVVYGRIKRAVRRAERAAGRMRCYSLQATPTVPDSHVRAIDNAIDATEALRHVDDRQRHILTRSFGLDGRAPEEVVEIGRGIGLSKSHTSLLKNQGLRAIRAAVA